MSLSLSIMYNIETGGLEIAEAYWHRYNGKRFFNISKQYFMKVALLGFAQFDLNLDQLCFSLSAFPGVHLLSMYLYCLQ